MKKRFSFTQAKIRELPTPLKGRVDYSDTEISKLVCRVSSTGNKSFLVTKRVNGKLKNVTIGKFSDVTVIEARKKAQIILTELNSGIDPVAEKRKQRVEKATLIELFEQYLFQRRLKPVTVKGYRYNLEHNFQDWLHLPASSITEAMVLKRQKKLSKTGTTTANVAMRVLRLTLKYAHAVGSVDTVATDILSKARLWHKNSRKERVIPSSGLKAWHEAVDDLPNYRAKVFLLTLLYMGYRTSEVLSFEWSNVDLKAKLIMLYDTKNGTNHSLPIPDVMLPYLKVLKKLTGHSRYVFLGSKKGMLKDMPDKPMSLPKKPVKVVADASGIEFSPHDCRRTFTTIAEAVNLPMSMIKRLMNHVTTNDVTGGYIITEEETLREAINKVASYIQAKISSESNVIKFNAR